MTHSVFSIFTGLALVAFLANCAGAADPIFPAALKRGDTIQFVAPAGSLDKKKMELCRERLVEIGFKVSVPDDLYRELGYLAGTDERRAEELNAAFADPNVDAIFPGTGGYGTMRILEQLDYDSIRNNPKVLVGFSDITALHVAIQQETGLVTFHSPNPMWGLGNDDNLTPLSAHWFWRAILAERFTTDQAGYRITPFGWLDEATIDPASKTAKLESVCKLAAPVTVAKGVAKGRLTGGNLSLVAALMGTPYQVQTKGKILFLEDVGESPYRIDRMLCTMRLGGCFDEVNGIILGQFTRRKSEDTSDETRSIDGVLDEYFGSLGIPVLKNYPLGHHKCNTTLPVGAMCELNADEATIEILENPVSIR